MGNVDEAYIDCLLPSLAMSVTFPVMGLFCLFVGQYIFGAG
jgi:hypothetical protein